MTKDEAPAMFETLSAMTVWQMLEATATRLPDKTAVVDGDRRLTYAEVRDGSRRLAAGLRALGLRRGSVAAVYLPNSAELVEVFYALQMLGVVIAWVNPNYREKELSFVLEDSGAEALFLFDEWGGFDGLTSVLGMGDVPCLRHVVAVRHRAGLATDDPRVRTLDQVWALGTSSGGEPADETAAAGAVPVGGAAATAADHAGASPAGATEVRPDDLSMLIYTSGTTAKPKGAMITQSQAVRAGFAYSLGVDATEDDTFIAFLPMSHSYGCGSLLIQPFVLGATVVLLDRFSPEKAFALIEREGVTLQLAAPAHYLMELADPTRAGYDLSSLRAGLIAGQLAPAGLISRVQDEMGIYLASFLGSSEVGPGLSIILPYGTPLEVRERSIGYPIEGTEARVLDPETGDELPPGASGELVLRGWHVTQGYWRNPEETAGQIRGGWLHTGDLVTRDEDGCFSIKGRLKDCINRGGFKIIPSEIESLIADHPGVHEVCVVGTPNPVLGESICACVVVAAGAELTLADIRRHLDGRIAPFKLPDELVVLPELPRMPGGVKVNRYSAGGVVELAENAPGKQTLAR